MSKSTYISRILAVLFAAIVAMAASAGTYTIENLPNPQLQDHTKHLFNPDGIVDAMTGAQIDTLLLDLRRRSSAEVVAVVVDDISEADIDTYATHLYNHLGLGKSDKNNGVLILVAKDRRKAVIRTGIGVEGVLPDIVCGGILRNKMFPLFKEGDYSGGVLAGVQSVHDVLTDPFAVAEIMSEERDNYSREEDGDIFGFYVIICCIVAACSLIYLIYKLIKVRGKDDYEKYLALDSSKAPMLVISCFCLFIPLIASLPLVALLYRWRNKPRKCKRCRAMMQKIDEVHDNDYLSPSQDLEERLNSVDYDVWRCPDCGETDILAYDVTSSSYSRCPNCGVKAYRLKATRELSPASTTREGRGEKVYECLHCNYTHSEPYTIAKLPPVVVIPGGGRGGGRGFGGGGGSFGGGGGSFGGGFGGGFTGGGGASGGW